MVRLELDKKEATSARPTIALVENDTHSTSKTLRRTSNSKKEYLEEEIALFLKKFKNFLRHNKGKFNGNPRKHKSFEKMLRK